MLVEETYHQRAQLLTKDYKKSYGVGCTSQVCPLLPKEYLLCLGNIFSLLKLSPKTTKRDHWNSLTYREDGFCQIIIKFQAYSTIISQILVWKCC